LRKLAQEN